MLFSRFHVGFHDGRHGMWLPRPHAIGGGGGGGGGGVGGSGGGGGHLAGVADALHALGGRQMRL